MLPKVFFAAAIVIACPAWVTAQDLFLSFSSTGVAPTSTVSLDAFGSGSAYIFSDGLFPFDAIDLNFTTNNSSVILLTGGEAFNPEFNIISGDRFSSSELTIDSATNSGNLFSVSVGDRGVRFPQTELFDPGFDAGVGPNGAVLLARADFDIVGSGTAELNFALGSEGALQTPDLLLNPSFGSATLIVAAVPEPSSLALLLMGSVGLVARRRRA